MRIVLLLSVTCMGYAMENQAINREERPLIQVQQEHPVQDAMTHCRDYHCGKLIMCGVLTCAGGLVGAGCWYAGGIDALRASSAVAQVMQ